MKKLISMAIAFVLIFALAVPTFAATAADVKTEIDTYAAKIGMSAADIAAAKDAVDKLSPAALGALNLANVEAAAKPYASKLKAGTATSADLTNMQADINKALPVGITIAISSVAINGTKLTAVVDIAISAVAAATGNPVVIPVVVSNNGTVAPAAPAAPAAAAANNPVKATGSNVDMTNIALLGFAIIAVLGASVVFTRKLGCAE